MIGVLLTILLMVGISYLAGVKEILTESFSDPSWMDWEDSL